MRPSATALLTQPNGGAKVRGLLDAAIWVRAALANAILVGTIIVAPLNETCAKFFPVVAIKS